MATLESAARIIHRPDTPSAPAASAKTASREPETESRTDLFTQDELFGVKKGQYIKKARARVLADIESLSGNCRWQDIVSLYHPVEDKLPELDEAGMADMVKEKIAFAMGHLKQFDDAISLLAACIRNDPDNFYTRSSLAYTAYSSLFAAKNREIFLAGAPRARRIELAHENFTRARKLRPDGVTNCYRHAMLSFVYTLLTNEVISAIKTCGLDPYLGSLHEISYGRPSLACDLVEEYRAPVGDRFVLQLLNRKMIRPEDFVYRKPGQKAYTDEKEMTSNRPVEMNPQLYKTFLAAYEQIMQGPSGNRNTIQAQVRSFADFLLDKESSYRPVKL